MQGGICVPAPFLVRAQDLATAIATTVETWETRKVTAKQRSLLGAFLVGLPFLTMFVIACICMGPLAACAIFGCIVLTAVCVLAGSYLLTP